MNIFLIRIKPKNFWIGLNIIGTTPLEIALKGVGYKMDNQVKGQFLLDAWIKRVFKTIIKFFYTPHSFRDILLSLPCTYQFLDHFFKNSKVILSVINSTEQWCEPLTKFYAKLSSNGVRIPSADY